jgi:hypothetical protein
LFIEEAHKMEAFPKEEEHLQKEQLEAYPEKASN